MLPAVPTAQEPTMVAYTLITAYPSETPGLVDGPWLQDCCRGLDEAKARAEDTSRANGGLPVAVVPRFGGPCAFLDGEAVAGVRPLFVAGDLSWHAAHAPGRA